MHVVFGASLPAASAPSYRRPPCLSAPGFSLARPTSETSLPSNCAPFDSAELRPPSGQRVRLCADTSVLDAGIIYDIIRSDLLFMLFVGDPRSPGPSQTNGFWTCRARPTILLLSFEQQRVRTPRANSMNSIFLSEFHFSDFFGESLKLRHRFELAAPFPQLFFFTKAPPVFSPLSACGPIGNRANALGFISPQSSARARAPIGFLSRTLPSDALPPGVFHSSGFALSQRRGLNDGFFPSLDTKRPVELFFRPSPSLNFFRTSVADHWGVTPPLLKSQLVYQSDLLSAPSDGLRRGGSAEIL